MDTGAEMPRDTAGVPDTDTVVVERVGVGGCTAVAESVAEDAAIGVGGLGWRTAWKGCTLRHSTPLLRTCEREQKDVVNEVCAAGMQRCDSEMVR
jgi:hypothetical protein